MDTRDSLRDSKIQTIAEFLKKYTEPIPTLSGISSKTLAEKLIRSLEELEIDEESVWLAKEQLSLDELEASKAFNL